MGIGRQSLYNAFGDKHSLFVEAVTHYVCCNTQPLIDTLQTPGSPLGNIRTAFEAIAAKTNRGECRGCFVTNAIVELAPHDEDVAKVVRSAIARIESSFKSALDQAVELKELAPKIDTKAVARFLNNTIQGMAVLGKASVSKSMLDDIVAVTLSTLDRFEK